ncbi:O-methyltransferase [Streptomyces lavendulae subsp. lavendulae]|uniref:methyltransferase n=1 Tax=Streptomyces lavendulae TaxID=1914 RepID=UPI0024A5E380|nr:methyltransferase [Streptomyces lavendulae]GLV84546.1 O-methyltransferase [Streptomyces lavendulae subsp. lavendulae]
MTSAQPVVDLMWAHWKTKTLLSALETGVFGELAAGPLETGDLAARTGVHARVAPDFFDALVALGLLERHGAHYANSPAAAAYLDPARSEAYLGGGFLDRSTGLADDLTRVLRSGEALNGAHTGRDYYESVYRTAGSVRSFQRDMTALSIDSARAIAEEFPWQDHRSLADIGCAEGALSTQVLLRHPHLTATGFDLPPTREGFLAYTAAHGLTERQVFAEGDFFKDDLPRADVIVFGHVLHNWDLETKKLLLRKAYEALPPGGAVLVYETLIDDERRDNAIGLILSLIMHMEVPEGFDYTGADCTAWMRECGFRDTRVRHLAGPESMVVAVKPAAGE